MIFFLYFNIFSIETFFFPLEEYFFTFFSPYIVKKCLLLFFVFFPTYTFISLLTSLIIFFLFNSTQTQPNNLTNNQSSPPKQK